MLFHHRILIGFHCGGGIIQRLPASGENILFFFGQRFHGVLYSLDLLTDLRGLIRRTVRDLRSGADEIFHIRADLNGFRHCSGVSCLGLRFRILCVTF